jgi:ketosteroid isomerase-like protein
MGGDRTNEELIELIGGGIRFSGGSALEGGEGIETIAALLTEVAASDYVCVMVSKEGIEREYPGVSGFRDALGDWITPYERFRLQIDEVVPVDDRLVFLVRQVGTTKHGGVEIETPSASVWDLEDGQIKRMTYYIDQQAAREAAGIG